MAVVVYSVNPYRALFDDGGGARFSFNGVDQYATMPGWAANGKPRQYWFNFIADAVATDTEQVIMSGVDGGIVLEFYLHETLPTMSIRYRSATGTQAIEQLVGIDIVPGNDYVIHVINLGTGSEVYINNVLIDILAFEASAGIQPALTHMGAKHDGTSFFGGTILASMLYDESPIHNTWANMGNGSRYGELEQAIVLEGDFEISFDWIRQNSAQVETEVLGGGTGDWIGVVNSGSTDNVNVGSNGVARVWVGAAADIAIGQHFNVRIVGTTKNSNLELFIDGISKGNAGGTLATTDFYIEKFYRGRSTQTLRGVAANSAVQNLIIKDLDNNLTWNYPLDEGPATGSVIHNTDPSTPGYNGTWTDTDWTFIADNTRRYPMNEGTGDVFKAYDEQGVPTPVNNATIQNFDESGWE